MMREHEPSEQHQAAARVRGSALAGRLDRRSLLKKTALIGLSAPAIASLLAACGDDNEATATTGAGAGAGTTATTGGGATTSPTTGGSAGGGGQDHTVKMTTDIKFDPDSLTIKVGDSVTWDNESTITHTATCDPSKAADASHVKLPDGAEPWDSGDVAAGETFSHTFDVAGEYDYICIPHEMAGMLGKVIVE